MLCILLLLSFTISALAKPILFTNLNDLEFVDPRLELHVNQPFKHSTVISPTEPWESWAVLGYNDVLRTPDGKIRMYYDCIEGSGVPPGVTDSKPTSFRRICLAESLDGISWNKPNLGLYNYVNPYTNLSSTQNNILLEDSGVSVFFDPSAPREEQWKMITSYFARSSADGLTWKLMCQHNKSTTDIDDTKPTGVYDPHEGSYVIYVRRDGAHYNRGIGRCVTDDLCDWEKFYHPNHCPTIFELENNNIADVYTNSYTPYPSIHDPSAHFFFPSIYFHFGNRPWGFPNDGLLDIQILASKDGRNIQFIDPDKFPYVPLDTNNCGQGRESRPNVTWGWCNPNTGELKNTSVATSVSYMASGFIFSNNGEYIYQYSSGQPFSHGGDRANKTWGSNSGIRLLINRRDGFTYIQAPQITSKLPFLVVKLDDIPQCKNQNLVMTINFETAVTGFINVAIMYQKNYSFEHSDQLKGSNLAAIVSWNSGKTMFLPSNSDAFLVQVFLNTAKLYALELKCLKKRV